MRYNIFTSNLTVRVLSNVASFIIYDCFHQGRKLAITRKQRVIMGELYRVDNKPDFKYRVDSTYLIPSVTKPLSARRGILVFR